MTKSNFVLGILVVWVLALTLHMAHPNSAPASGLSLGTQVQIEPFWFTGGIKLGPNSPSDLNAQIITMGPGQNQTAWLNNTGKTVYTSSVDALAVLTATSTGASITASTTLALWAGTSTVPTLTDSQTNPIYGSLFDKVFISTSTPNLAHDGVANSAFSGSNEQGLIAIPNGQYLMFMLENPYQSLTTAGNAASGYGATSTVRGYNISISFPYWSL